jgi:hypothetical protein
MNGGKPHILSYVEGRVRSLSDVEGHLGGAISEPCFTQQPEEPFLLLPVA